MALVQEGLGPAAGFPGLNPARDLEAAACQPPSRSPEQVPGHRMAPQQRQEAAQQHQPCRPHTALLLARKLLSIVRSMNMPAHKPHVAVRVIMQAG